MATEKFEEAISSLDPQKRALLKRIAVGAAFALPTISSFAVRDLAFGQLVSGTITVTAPGG